MQISHASANGIDIAYETFGDRSDPPVVLVMGLSTQMLAWRDEFCADLAARGYYVVRFDNRDVGLSTHLSDLPAPAPIPVAIRLTPPAYRIQDMAADTIGLLDALELGPVHLVGASMGGFIAQHVALAAPQRVASLTLIMTSTGSRRVGGPSGRLVAAVLRRRPAADRQAAVAASLSMLRLIQSPAYPVQEADALLVAGESFDRAYDTAGGRRQLAAVLTQEDRTEALGALTMPTLVMHGLRDPLVRYSGGLALAKAIPGARFVAFHGMGHDLPRELWPDYIEEIDQLARRARVVENPGRRY